jgi:asparagine synthase (glutamine-hydrolysing)
MARIAAVFHPALPGQAPALLGPVTARLTQPGWRQSQVISGPAALAWSGWREPSAADAEGVIAVVDGRFYSADEFAIDGRDEAAQLADLYRRLGFEGALARINGDFACALYDPTEGHLWLGRDRFGQRPLYYAPFQGGLVVASQPWALLAIPGVPRGVNRRFVAVFAGSHYRYIDNRPDESPYAGVRQLPAGSALRARAGSVALSRYWTLTEADELADDEGAIAERYRELLLDSVRRRYRALPDPAFTLSGGLDSSTVLSAAVEASGKKQNAFSSIYSDKTYDESEEIRGFVEHKVERWHPVAIEKFDLFDTVRRMVRAHGEPVATATWLSHFMLCDQVRRAGFKSLFGGLGGDELNAGEYEYFFFHFADLAHAARRAELEHEIACWARHHDHPVFRKSREVAVDTMARVTDSAHAGVIRVDERRLTRYHAAVSPDYYDLARFRPEMDHPFSSWLKNRTYQDLFRETAPCCLRAEDRDCVAFGLEHADPFFDHRLVEFMFRVPGVMKIRDGVTKRLLREAMRDILPEETRTRVKKTGWNAPAHVWFSGRARAQLLELIESSAFRDRGVYDVAEVRKIVKEHFAIVESGAQRENHMMFLWQLVNLELWLESLEAPDRIDRSESVPGSAAP